MMTHGQSRPDSDQAENAGSETNRLKKIFGLTAFISLLSLIVWFPLYSILIPPSADLSQHVLVNKLLWEKISGASHLDIEISWLIGYRLLSVVLVGLFALSEMVGISFVYFPKLTVLMLVLLHCGIVGGCLYFQIPRVTIRNFLIAFCVASPAAACLYSASWYVGFVGFTLGISLLIPAIFLVERYTAKGRPIDLLLHFITLILIYTAHPFVLAFWFFWWLSRALFSVITLKSWLTEWKRLFMLGIGLVPIVIYHVAATYGGGGATLSIGSMMKEHPFVSFADWYRLKVHGILTGSYLQPDYASSSQFFAVVCIIFVLVSILVAFRGRGSADLRKTALTSVFFLLLSSFINESFFPIPHGHWLAYDFRWGTAAYAVALAISAMVVIRSLDVDRLTIQKRVGYAVIALICISASLVQVNEVKKAYARFDTPAREYVEQVFNHQRPTDQSIPRTVWQSDGKFLSLYGCLKQPDCNPAGTLFRKLGGDLYPIRVKSNVRLTSPGEPPFDPRLDPLNVLVGGEGYGRGYLSRPRGLTIDAERNIYVADTGNARIQKFNPTGDFLFASGQYGRDQGQFAEPSGIAIDIDGRIYVVDGINKKLVRLTASGEFEKEWADKSIGFNEPRDIAIAPNGKLLILDLALGRVIAFDPTNETFEVWKTGDDDSDRMLRPTGITCSGGLVFVAELGNNQIRIFDLTGKPVRTIAVAAWGKYVWHYPDLAFDEVSKRLYATDGWEKKVLIYDVNGPFIGSAELGSTTGIENLSSIALRREGESVRLYLLNTGSEIYDVIDPGVTISTPQ